MDSRTGSGNTAEISVDFTTLGFKASDTVTVRDLFAHKDLGTFTGSYKANVPEHGV